MFCIRARTSFWWLLTGEVTKITPSDGRRFCGYFIHSLPRLKWILCWISTLSSSQFHQSKCLHILVLSLVFFLESSCTYSGPQQWCMNERAGPLWEEDVCRCLCFASCKKDYSGWFLFNHSYTSREQVESDLIFLGLLILENRLKEETKPVLEELISARIRTVMITGIEQNMCVKT